MDYNIFFVKQLWIDLVYIELPKIIIIFNIIYIYTDKFESIERPSVFKNALTNDSLLNNKYNII